MDKIVPEGRVVGGALIAVGFGTTDLGLPAGMTDAKNMESVLTACVNSDWRVVTVCLVVVGAAIGPRVVSCAFFSFCHTHCVGL